MALRTYRITFIALINIFFLLIPCLLWLITKPFAVINRKLVVSCIHLWSRLMCHYLGIKVISAGIPKDKSAFFIVSNHLSYTDIPVLASIFDCVFVSKEEVKDWLIIGQFSRIVGTIFVNRNSKMSTFSAIQDAERVLKSNRSIVLFPEATTSDGSAVREFKSAFFSLPEKMNAPILPVAINYKDKKTGLRKTEVPWYDNKNMLSHFWQLIGNKGIIAEVICSDVIKLGNNNSTQSIRKELAKLSWTRVSDAYKASIGRP